jgi:hypothetical protein
MNSEKKEIEKQLIYHMDDYFGSIKPLRHIQYLLVVVILMFFITQYYIYDFVVLNVGNWGLLINLFLAIYMFQLAFKVYPKIIEITSLNSETGYYIFRLKFGKEYDQWYQENTEKGYRTILEKIGSCKSKKDVKEKYGDSKFTSIYFNKLKGYPYLDIEKWIEVIMVKPSEENDKHKFNMAVYWKDKKRIEKHRI